MALESVGHLDAVDLPTREVTNSCRTLSVMDTSSYSTRYYQTIYALQMYMMESKQPSRTMACQLCTTALGPDDNNCVWSSDEFPIDVLQKESGWLMFRLGTYVIM